MHAREYANFEVIAFRINVYSHTMSPLVAHIMHNISLPVAETVALQSHYCSTWLSVSVNSVQPTPRARRTHLHQSSPSVGHPQLPLKKITNRSFRHASPCLWNQLAASFRQPRPNHSLSHSSGSSLPSSPHSHRPLLLLYFIAGPNPPFPQILRFLPTADQIFPVHQTSQTLDTQRFFLFFVLFSLSF